MRHAEFNTFRAASSLGQATQGGRSAWSASPSLSLVTPASRLGRGFLWSVSLGLMFWATLGATATLLIR